MRKQWRCFHCDEVFTSRRCAATHFGADETATPACKLASFEGHLVEHIRELEDQLAQYRSEDSHVLRALYAQQADHRQALIRAEEAGYNRGVRDMSKPEALAELGYVPASTAAGAQSCSA